MVANNVFLPLVVEYFVDEYIVVDRDVPVGLRHGFNPAAAAP